MHRHRSRLKSRSAIAIDNHRANPASAELIREHQTRWAGTNYENVGIHCNLQNDSMAGAASRFFKERLCRLGRIAPDTRKEALGTAELLEK